MIWRAWDLHYQDPIECVGGGGGGGGSERERGGGESERKNVKKGRRRIHDIM